MHLSFYNIISFLSYTHLQFSRSLVSDSLQHHGLQHFRCPCPSPSPGACSNSCRSSQWFHPTISSSVIPFSSCLQSFSASVSFFSKESVVRIVWLEYWSFIISPSNEYSGPISLTMDWFDLLAVQKTLTQFKSINSLVLSFLYGKTLTSMHDYWKNHSFDDMDLWGKVMSLLSNTQTRLVIAFLPRSKRLLISWLQL